VRTLSRVSKSQARQKETKYSIDYNRHQTKMYPNSINSWHESRVLYPDPNDHISSQTRTKLVFIHESKHTTLFDCKYLLHTFEVRLVAMSHTLRANCDFSPGEPLKFLLSLPTYKYVSEGEADVTGKLRKVKWRKTETECQVWSLGWAMQAQKGEQSSNRKERQGLIRH